ncbi:hypothetical protein ABIA30_002299 [Mycobacterium sp. MAA66]|uniref:DUF6779 domain-containing protein n=1 Tax=Mycobacterium sp. MAA66 TaxID=3156297 RepID=UPI003510E2FC
MTDPSRGVRARRPIRRPGWALLTTLLVLAIVASSALVFTDEVQLLKLAVVLALWAAVAAAFVSFIYRRQADADKARIRDLKTVYNLQLDREISARREYELSVESHLRRELASELRAQSADEVAALRAELAALRTHLEILFDTDLEHRPALGTVQSAERNARVIASRIDTEDRREKDAEPKTEESPIIDVAAEPHPSDEDWAPSLMPQGGAHRRAHETAPETPGPVPQPSQPPTVPPPAPPIQPPAGPVQPPAAQWRPVEVEGQWIPAGAPGSNWVAPAPEDDRGPEPTMTLPAVPPQRRSRYAEEREPAGSVVPESDQGPRTAPPALAVPVSEPTPARHRSAEEEEQPGQHAGGQSAAELLARLQVNVGEGGRRRRRED